VSDQSERVKSTDHRIDAALCEYLERVDRGEAVEREEFLSKHPEIAAELRSILAAEEQLRNLAGAKSPIQRSVRSTQSFALHGQETIAPQFRAAGAADVGESGLAGEFGRYRIIRALGKGAMGTVYLAEDTQLQRQVALKTPQFEQEPTPELLERFYREARAAGTLRHPNICPVYDVGQIGETHYISMAYIDGHPLSAFVRSAKPQPERQILIIIRKLAQALQEAHDLGIVHRDLKPANIMVDKRNEPIIMDFGLARQLQRETNIRITQSGMLIGTPAYMSPEQVDGEPDGVGPASDQYSLGVILYELLTGQLPFRGSLTAVMAQIITKETTPPSQLRPELDLRIEAACLKMMAKDPTNRFASLSAAAEEFAAILKNPSAKQTAKDAGKQAAATPPPAESNTATASVLKSQTKKTVSGKDLASLEELARKCLARHDYDQVIQIVERIPEEKRSAGLAALLEKSREKTDEIAFLICEIDEAVRLKDRATALKKADELLTIKPAHHRALQVQQEFAGYGAGGAARIGKLQQFAQPWNEGGWIPWSVLAFGLAVCGALMAIVMIYVNGTAVEVDIKDPGVVVTVKGKEITITGPKDERVVVEPGEQKLKITYAGLETVTTSFFIKKGEKKLVTVSIVNAQITANLDRDPSSLALIPDRGKLDKAKGAAEASPKLQDKSNALATAALAQKKELAEAKLPRWLAAPFDATAAKNARQQWADHLKRPGEVTNAIGMKLALIPPGEFHMGSADPRMPNDARPVHRVRITKPIYLGVYEVTQAEFQRIMGVVNPSHFRDDPRLPVESITWDDVQKFLGKLNAMPEERQAGREYRLPTEAEWEYACRAGTETLFSFGDAITTNQANFDGEQQSPFGIPKGTWLKRTTRVGSYPANAFGIHDMEGNVLEGVADWYSSDYYASSPVDDPQGPATGKSGGARGGSWHSPASPPAFRVAGPRNTRSDEVGFRVACDILPVEGGAAANALASAASAGVSAQEGFVPLFNGKDLSGWKVGKFNPGNWRVEHGVLVGSKSPFGFIHTVRDDFTDFHLRVEARLNDGGNGGVIVRGNNAFYGYEADLNNPRDTGSNRTGTLWTQRETLVGFLEPLVPPGEWFTLDVIAEGNHIVVQVNGRTTADYTDEKQRSSRGNINMQQAHEETVVEFRKIEIKELEARKTAVVVRSQADQDLLIAPFDESEARKAQENWSDRLKTPVDWTNKIEMKLILIPPGEFQMGDLNAGEHAVRITRPFYLGAYEVTRGQFAKFVAAEHFKTQAERDKGGLRPENSDLHFKSDPKHQYTWRHPGFSQDDTHPVVDVSWDDAREFCDWLSRKEGTAYRLPTEAEWEYACRAGTTTRTYNGDDQNSLTTIGNVADATARKQFSVWAAVKSSDAWVYTSPVGLFRPNHFGLHDTIGNVNEWCSDWYGKDYYKTSPQSDPPGPSAGEFRVGRGGSYLAIPVASYRWKYSPWVHLPDWGFRVACEIAPSSSAAKTAPSENSAPEVFADFESGSYGRWKKTGTAFGSLPARGALRKQQTVSGYGGQGLVNSFFGGDRAVGTLTSPQFTIRRTYIQFRIGGGHCPGKACINLLSGGKVVRTATGANDERLMWSFWEVSNLRGQTAQIEIVDKETGGWGHINIDDIRFANEPPAGVEHPQSDH
jgi:formylglycine-generating enzyme required for sulfatase activity/predicted Ser/Thr protein kinase